MCACLFLDVSPMMRPPNTPVRGKVIDDNKANEKSKKGGDR